MMTSLFSIFNPSTSMYYSLNWTSMIYPIMFLPLTYWLIPSRYNIIFFILKKFITKELKITLPNKDKCNMIMFYSLFIMILSSNLTSLFPYIFPSSSHLNFSLMPALSLWMSIFIMNIFSKLNIFLAHFIPFGTPKILIPLMIMIEFSSNLIRPITLSIRLTANIIAGHLLITLINSSYTILNLSMLIMMISSQTLLMILELSVACIQAYVFMTLISIYSSE